MQARSFAAALIACAATACGTADPSASTVKDAVSAREPIATATALRAAFTAPAAIGGCTVTARDTGRGDEFALSIARDGALPRTLYFSLAATRAQTTAAGVQFDYKHDDYSLIAPITFVPPKAWSRLVLSRDESGRARLGVTTWSTFDRIVIWSQTAQFSCEP